MKLSQSAVLNRLFALTAAMLLIALGTPASFAQTAAASSAVVPATPVDVNSADLKTLETLPGVGAATAKKIIAGRPYQSVADLSKVKGLSATKLSAIKDQLVFGPATAAPTPAAAAATAPAAKTVSTATSTATSRSRSATNSAANAAASRLAPGQQININTASAADLDKLPDIGPAKAQAIVNYRTQNGNFASIEDIEKVKGIKAGTFAKIKAYIKVSN